ncbi:hypothetical protein [Smaragdicoccus niigatensis]|uniref:hypothetical protein n=1 Tax=Smaragdicoccus niigatensis TaxID=359359 RepID=UPI000377B277|nr:hypothetical protein [Smaragdicoccus niigatensis]
MKPASELSDAELASEFRAVARLRHEGPSSSAEQLIRRQTAVLDEMTRRAERAYEV